MRIKFVSLLTMALTVSAVQIASAADLPTKAPVYKAPPPVVAYNWAGFYIGAHVGGAWGNTDISQFSDFLEGGSMNVSGAFGGGQIGFNWMASPNILLGLEADVSGGKLSGSMNTSPPFVSPERLLYEDKIDVFGTARGRVGYVQNNWLVYGTGGFAWAEDTLSRTQLAGNPQFSPPIGSVFSHDGTRTGWTAGAGIEWGIAPHWSAKLEYLYMDFAGQNFNFADVTHPLGTPCSGGNICVTEGHLKVNTIKVGVNYIIN